MKDVVHSQCKPLGEVIDYFWRKEFASRGAIHVHWFAYIKDAPVHGESSNTEIALFYDKIISCSLDVPEHHKQFVMYQLHRHSKSCRFRQTNTCRFNFPRPPMRQTCVLEPFHPNEKDEEDEGKIYWEQIKKYLDNYKLGLDVEETFDNMLENFNMNEEQYIKGIRSSVACVQFF